MEEKKYSIQEIQRLTNLSPATLQAILHRNRKFLALEVRHNDSGQEEIFLDQMSFERLMFLKQLELGEKLSLEERLNLLHEAGPATTGENPEANEPLGGVFHRINTLTTMVSTLQGRMDLVLSRYNQVLNDLQTAVSDNVQMKMELESMREKQHLLIRQVQQMSEKKEEPQPDRDLIN